MFIAMVEKFYQSHPVVLDDEAAAIVFTRLVELASEHELTVWAPHLT
jgi:small-conductance mechanosensitive channel